jgi:hypothetical protein
LLILKLLLIIGGSVYTGSSAALCGVLTPASPQASPVCRWRRRFSSDLVC